MSKVAAVVALLATSPKLPIVASGARTPVPGPVLRTAVVGIHMDQPYLDATGRVLPYVPPSGLRSGAPIARLTELELRSRFVYL